MDSVFYLPLQQRLEVAALMHRVQVRQWLPPAADPVVRDYTCVARTHQVLADHIDAVVFAWASFGHQMSALVNIMCSTRTKVSSNNLRASLERWVGRIIFAIDAFAYQILCVYEHDCLRGRRIVCGASDV